MSDRRNGLYYESKDIRNSVLLRNIGEYTGYKYSMLYNGGLAIGMPYAVETEFVPYTLAEKSMAGLQVTVSPGQINAFGKKENPNINLAWKEGGLFGYTHEVINNEYDWLSRNVNLPESYYDYNSTEDLIVKLDRFPNSLPWGQSTDIIGGVESGGLRAFSSHNDPQNSVFYNDYTDYVRDIFTNGVSFDKQLGEHYVTNLLYDGFSKDTVDTGVVGFIDEKSGFIIDDVDEDLKPIEDTKLAYIGRIMLGEEKDKQIKNVERVGKGLYITNTLGLYYGLSSASLPTLKQEMLGGAGVSYDFDMADSLLGGDSRFIVELDKSYDDEVLDNENTDEDETYLGYSVSNPQMRYLRDVHERARRSQSFYRDGINDKYIEYYNVRDFGSTAYLGEFDENGEYYEKSSVTNDEIRRESVFGDSVEGFFRAAGVYDGNLGSTEHYDEQDGINTGERDILSKKISYNQPERIGLANDYGFSSNEKSLLEKTKRLFEQHKIKTLIGRFHTSADDNGATSAHLTQTATNPTYGISHGRNLLKLNPTYENGYDNPYCRVWTYHHQYSKMTDLIRPFTDGENFMSLDGMQAAYPGRPILRNGGRQSWAEKTVLNKNGMVNIAPTRKIGDDDKNRVKAKQCMFSIENLAWKSVNRDPSNIDAGEIGPLGGRIMWFPPYNLTFNESVSVTWGGNDFIGRGERIYSYTNTERSGSLSFTILADHPSILDYWMNSDNRRSKPGTEEDQQKVLRFFAGCENLEAEEQVASEINGIKTDYYAKKENQENKPENPQDKTDPIPEENKEETPATMPPDEFTKDNSIGFYVFFPNNLSGIDFVKNPKVIVNYLVNGRNGFEFNPNLDGNEEHHILPSESTVIGDWSDNVMMLTNGPGYEMGRSSNTGLTDNETRTDVSKYNTAHDGGRDYLWGYGIDKDKVKERLCGPHGAKGDKSYKLYVPNYYDSTDYKLNATPGDDACKYSFADVAVALTTDYKYSGKGEVAENVEEIKKILGIKEGEVKQQGRKYYFAIAGGASVHGYVDRNTGLSNRRASFLRSWLEDCFKKLNLQVDYDESAKIPTFTEIAGGEEDLYVNSRGAKRGRYARAVIYWNDEDVTDATEANSEYTPGAEHPEGIISVQESTMPNESENQDTVAESATYLNSVALHDFSSTRYRDEEKFFDMLKESDPVIYKNIVDKVKYFDPIYHSITPEGFNARLSFLHQCTRQGPTISSSDLSQNNGFNGAGYAGNLSFGRAPVCVLRLGDFFNTRIIINSLNIQYEQPQWDLNPEGIGVQPMLANVTISFVFQGGSSLGGPIQRLQNAVSFNYYANQEVYDDRADVAVYKSADETGGTGELDMDASMIWMPGYGNVNLGSVTTAIDIMKSPAGTARDNIDEMTHESIQAKLKQDQKKAKEFIESQGEQSQQS